MKTSKYLESPLKKVRTGLNRGAHSANMVSPISFGMNLASFGRNSSNLVDLSSLLKKSNTPELREVLKSSGTAPEVAAKSNTMMPHWTFIFAD